ncbi:uncharacterized protein LOC111695063 isoform X2 [Eurytemora carolleeae]|uniref:uncharacterized protein LOC111695063 isoform X2 n=1 Tax=Eurytemora carolleeae TaxID=1294199 RepID=UPI000C77D858|nr:uncharacterized protein LOC111695063 isoform X2 [Eurytemora carolleeae]|eukprot:XP_023319993.1 uncharacterized protein LOC111695063 isoform X2 [Eurytemora affinis]
MEIKKRIRYTKLNQNSEDSTSDEVDATSTVSGHIEGVHYQDRFWPLIFLGSIMFLPGAYHTYFAFKAFTGDPDWDFEEFPDF